MKKEGITFIEHILECIKLIEEYLKDKSREDFLTSVQLQDSVIRRIEIIGEAVKNIPNDVKDKYPDIPWKKIAGMRDKLIHEYFGVDYKIVWDVVSNKIPKLKEKLKGIIEKERWKK